MKYLIFASRADADSANHKISRGIGTKGCRGEIPRCADCVSNPCDTKYWYACVTHPSDGRVALVIDDAQYLTEIQTDALLTELDTSWAPQNN